MKKRINKYKVKKKASLLHNNNILNFFVIISKVLDNLYFIPLYMIIGEKNGALYGYALTFFLFIISIFSTGIPYAISKVTSEYQTLGYYSEKKQVFNIGRKLSINYGIICFCILYICAPILSNFIMGPLHSPNTANDITYVIRLMSIAILIVPLLTIYRGYFEGNKYINQIKKSQILERLIKIMITIIGGFLGLKVFNLPLEKVVGICILATVIGSFLSYLYLLIFRIKNENISKEKKLMVKKIKITDKQIIKKIIIYSYLFVIIDIIKTSYITVDSITVVKALKPIYGINDSETIMGILSIWANTFNIFIISIALKNILSFIPNLKSSIAIDNKLEINNKINNIFQKIIFFLLPIIVIFSFLSKAIYMLFYGTSEFGSSILSFYIFQTFPIILYIAAITICYELKDYKLIMGSFISGLLLKILINVSLIKDIYNLGLPGYYGPILASILGYFLSLIICLVVLNIKYNINYEKTVNQIFNITGGTIIMLLILFLLKIIIPISLKYRLLNIFIIIIYTTLGSLIYLFCMKKTNTIKNTINLKNKKNYKITINW